MFLKTRLFVHLLIVSLTVQYSNLIILFSEPFFSVSDFFLFFADQEKNWGGGGERTVVSLQETVEKSLF